MVDETNEVEMDDKENIENSCNRRDFMGKAGKAACESTCGAKAMCRSSRLPSVSTGADITIQRARS